ncbi:alpha/beta fold hydrolase [Tropicimonas sp. TH_r6]|uniref:alpha/beta fold hydrolase n=1 Tax=Tropicimonas sp. TH_r6 TaxID=3082085 RepID=UPI002954DC98|nr:alpha/beta fold hydrolase [Tropicimonas sp. TH_r6]MDV7142480.1 alpha/beta fold hydrolase [Tropicimonas sp. TH_r6]
MRRIGHGPEQAVALHCTLAHGGAWAPMVASLADELTLLAPDLPGHGSAPDWQGGDFLAASLAVLDATPDGPRHVIGHSFGAVVALEHALRAPERVRSLTLIEPVLFAAARSPDARDAIDTEKQELTRHFDADDREGAARFFTGVWGTGLDWECLPRPARNRIAAQIHVVPDQTPALHEDCAGILAAGRLEALDLPVLLIEGRDSPPVVADIVGTLAERIAGARRVRIAEAGHMVPLSHPAEVAEVFRASFLRENPAKLNA